MFITPSVPREDNLLVNGATLARHMHYNDESAPFINVTDSYRLIDAQQGGCYAVSERKGASMTARSGGMVRDFMHRNLEVVPPETTTVEAAVRMREKSLGSLLAVPADAAGRVSNRSGIVTETDLVRKVFAKEMDASLTRVNQIMTTPLLTITQDRPMLDASHLMETNHVRHVCVSDAEEIVGMISVRDLVRYFIDSEGGPIRDLDNVFRPLSVLRVLMQTTMETIASERTVLEAGQAMAEKRIGSLLVLEAGAMVGIVTETDVVRKVIAAGLPARSTSIGAVMNAPLIQIDIDSAAGDASRLMAEKRIRHLAVTEENKVVGLLSLRDLVKVVSIRDESRFLRST
jgi:signal-transduction protein with cAMP-binding, CBS, and nucleotidyltransferase domain